MTGSPITQRYSEWETENKWFGRRRFVFATMAVNGPVKSHRKEEENVRHEALERTATYYK